MKAGEIKQNEMKAKIRRAKLDDFEQISELMQEFMGDPVNDRQHYFENALKSNNYVALVAELEKNIVGFLDIWSFPDIGHGAILGLIGIFVVRKEYREKGIGSRLLEKSMKIAKSKKFHEFHVWTDSQNKKAIEIYKKHGFTYESLLLEKEFD